MLVEDKIVKQLYRDAGETRVQKARLYVRTGRTEIEKIHYEDSGNMNITGKVRGQEVYRTYIVKTRGIPSEKDLEKLRHGVKIEDYVTSPAKVELLLKDNTNDIARIWIQIHEGRNRQVRKMCEAIGLSVIALKREGVGNLTCEGVEKGKWRYLTKDEVLQIMNA